MFTLNPNLSKHNPKRNNAKLSWLCTNRLTKPKSSLFDRTQNDPTPRSNEIVKTQSVEVFHKTRKTVLIAESGYSATAVEANQYQNNV